MALTPELIKANEALADLSDAHVAAITALSANDENVVIGKKVGELHGAYDKDIQEISGVEKNEVEKSYDYLKRVLGEFKTKAESTSTLTTEIETYKGTIADLQKQIKDGNGDASLKQQLSDAEGRVKALTTQLETDKASWEKEKDEFTGQLQSIKVNGQFEKATAGLKFKAAYPENVQKTLIDSAQRNILSANNPDWVEDATSGKKIMVFRDANGEIVRNPANAQNPFTAEELLRKELGEVLETGKKTPGGNTKPPEGGGGSVDITELSSAKTQVEADDIIYKHLMSKGITRGSSEFSAEQKRIRDEAKIDDLPIR